MRIFTKSVPVSTCLTMAKLLDKKKLRNEYEILFLNYHRNKNQHGSATWFKYLNILVRHLRKLLMKTCSKYQLKSLDHLNKHIIPKLYYAFNGVIAQGQFITLGFALIGSLSKIHGLTCELVEKSSAVPSTTDQPSFAGTEQDLGEEIIIDSTNGISSKPPRVEVLRKKSEAESFTKKRSTIDEIFDSKKKKSKKKKRV